MTTLMISNKGQAVADTNFWDTPMAGAGRRCGGGPALDGPRRPCP